MLERRRTSARPRRRASAARRASRLCGDRDAERVAHRACRQGAAGGRPGRSALTVMAVAPSERRAAAPAAAARTGGFARLDDERVGAARDPGPQARAAALGLSIDSVPSSAARRSCRPRRPVPARSARRRRRRRARRRPVGPRARPPRARSRVALATFVSASATTKYAAASTGAGGRSRSTSQLDGERRRVGQRRDAGPRPRSVRTRGGCRGRARAARRARRRAGRQARRARRGLRSPRPALRSRRSIASATSCCWAPSWRSRSIRRRAASAASTIRARETPQLLHPRAQVGLQPLVLERERRGAAAAAGRARARVERGVVHKRRDSARHHARPPSSPARAGGGQVDRPPGASTHVSRSGSRTRSRGVRSPRLSASISRHRAAGGRGPRVQQRLGGARPAAAPSASSTGDREHGGRGAERTRSTIPLAAPSRHGPRYVVSP